MICKVKKNMRMDREGAAHSRGPISTKGEMAIKAWKQGRNKGMVILKG